VVRPTPAAFDGQDDFATAIRLLSADVRATTNLRPVIMVRFDDEKHMLLYSFDGHQFGPLRASTAAEAVMAIADLVQDDMIDNLWPPWPPCPGHGHPAQAELRSGQPVWVCPGTGTLLSEIGHLSVA
jgi:hypothetical protein